MQFIRAQRALAWVGSNSQNATFRQINIAVAQPIFHYFYAYLQHPSNSAEVYSGPNGHESQSLPKMGKLITPDPCYVTIYRLFDSQRQLAPVQLDSLLCSVEEKTSRT